MEILSRKETGMGSNFVLVKYSDDFYAHGTEADMSDKYGFPVNACGTKEEVLNHCKSISELCKKNINKYHKGQLEHPKGWDILIKREEKELEALTEFEKVLNK